MAPYKVLLTTSGVGSRLDDLTKYTNKALVRIGRKPAISYILDRIGADVPIVVTLGHHADLVVQFLKIAHPDRQFEYVYVDPYQGPRSSLGFSMLSAKDRLCCPFVFVASDTLISTPIEPPDRNWTAVAKADNSDEYSTVSTTREKVLTINSKGSLHYDFAHIGLVGVRDFAAFWETLAELYARDPEDQSLNDCAVINRLIAQGYEFGYKVYNEWLDIGNVKALERARKQVPDRFDNLDKPDETIYLFEPDVVVKFFHKTELVQRRIARARLMRDSVPRVVDNTENFYSYEWVDGDIYSGLASEHNIDSFFAWACRRLWRPVVLSDEQQVAFPKICRKFYHDKTRERVQQFHALLNLTDGRTHVNGAEIPASGELLDAIDWDWLCDGIPAGFHGDLHFENVLALSAPVNRRDFKLLDWRQDFGGVLEYGDIYYDLAKLNHGMVVSHDIVKRQLFNVEVSGDHVSCDILRPERLVRCQQRFYDFLNRKHFDIQKVELLTNLVFLNIAALHHYPYNLFLYHFGRQRLWSCLCSYVSESAGHDVGLVVPTEW